MIIIHKDFLPLYDKIKPLLEIEVKIIIISEGEDCGQPANSFAGEYETLLEGKNSDYIFPDFDENAIATIFYTTGTTGQPKGVTFSHRQIVLHTYGFLTGLSSFDSYATVNSADVYMPITPMFHVHAWGMPYVFTMLGSKQVYPGRYEPARLLSLIKSEKVTFSHCVPTILHMLLADPAVTDTDLSRWKVIIGGAALSTSLCKKATELGINLFSAYGMSETCPLMTIAIPKPHMLTWTNDELVDVRTRTGLPVPLVDLEIIDPAGLPLPHDGKQKGEIVVRSPWLAQSYYKDQEKSDELWRDGWLHTGDLGVIDDEGYVQITDRIKDVIKTGGEWISSIELENLIGGHEAAAEAAVIGIPDEKWGERPLALVVIKTGYEGKISEVDFSKYINGFVDQGVLPKYGVPDQIMIVDSIAKTSVGKLNKKALREKYGSQ